MLFILLLIEDKKFIYILCSTCIFYKFMIIEIELICTEAQNEKGFINAGTAQGSSDTFNIFCNG